MIDERTRQMIEWYLPNPPDPELEEGEYYYRQSTMKGEQVIKVRVTAIFPGEVHQPEEYEIYQIRSDGLRWVDVGWGDRCRGAFKSQLYDNKQDCRDQTHQWAEDWEHLREIQKKEGLL
jgi:hypothetical protein